MHEQDSDNMVYSILVAETSFHLFTVFS